MNNTSTIEQTINGTTFQFFVSIELQGSHATVNVEPIGQNKQKFEKLDNASAILESIAKDTLSNKSDFDYKLMVNQSKTGDQWLGQFARKK